MAAYEVLLLNTAIPQIQAAQSGDTYVVPRDIAFSAALTLSAGTANGVPYLNGSNVVTTNSALTFDGTNLTNAGVGTFRTLVLNGVGASQLGTSDASGLYIDANTSGGMYLQSGNNFIFRASAAGSYAERARITSGGAWLVGVNAAAAGSSNTVLWANNSEWAFRVQSSASSSPNGLLIKYSGASPNSPGDHFLYCQDSGNNERMSVFSNGGISNYQGNDSNLSDRREKTNFAPAKSYLDTICAIPVQTFNYIDQSEDDPGLTLGVVAQDVQAVAPELVSEANWGTEENPKMRLSIYQTDLQYALMKCIQELKAQNDELRQRVAALETKGV